MARGATKYPRPPSVSIQGIIKAKTTVKAPGGRTSGEVDNAARAAGWRTSGGRDNVT